MTHSMRPPCCALRALEPSVRLLRAQSRRRCLSITRLGRRARGGGENTKIRTMGALRSADRVQSAAPSPVCVAFAIVAFALFVS